MQHQQGLKVYGRSRKITWGLVLLTFISLLVGWWVRRPRSISEEAVRLAQHFADGNADALYDASSTQETGPTHLTRERFRELFKKVIWPAVNQFKPSSAPLTEVLMAGSTAAAYLPATDRSGHKGEFIVTAFSSNTGPKMRLTGMVLQAWNLKYVVAAGLPLTQENIGRARALGKARDGKTLRDLGILGVYDTFSGEVVPWEHLK